jgi:nucleotide-binding universal stress UspA family protein
MYESIIVPVDLGHGEIGERTLRLARHLGGPGAAITLLHVLDPVPSFAAVHIPPDLGRAYRKQVEEQLEELAGRIHPPARVAVRQGNAAAEILDAIGEIGADAVVMGSHRPGYRDLLIGSTAARVVRHAPCSVMVDRSHV